MLRVSRLMYASAPLSASAITEALQALPGWRQNANKLETEIKFGSFAEAIHFIQRLVPICDGMDHHPCIINVYNRITLKLTTHDAGNQVTEKDVRLAQAIQKLHVLPGASA